MRSGFVGAGLSVGSSIVARSFKSTNVPLCASDRVCGHAD